MSILRNTITSSAALLCLVVAGPASAQEAGSFKTNFTKVVDNCEKGLDLSKATLQISKDDRNISVTIDSLPTLKGKSGKRGKLRAEATGTDGGMDVRYGLNGRVSDGALQAVFVAEYYSGKTPVCTQSFRVVGKVAKKSAPKPKAAKRKATKLTSDELVGLSARHSWNYKHHRGAYSGF